MNETLKKIMPHAAPMLLIEDIVDNTDGRLVVGLRITPKSFGFEDGGVPGWFGIEYMAQGVAAYNGLNFSKTGKPEIGFLVGVSNYRVDMEKFPDGAELQIELSPSFVTENSGSFDCKIRVNGEETAEGTVTTYKPTSAQLEQLRSESNG